MDAPPAAPLAPVASSRPPSPLGPWGERMIAEGRCKGGCSARVREGCKLGQPVPGPHPFQKLHCSSWKPTRSSSAPIPRPHTAQWPRRPSATNPAAARCAPPCRQTGPSCPSCHSYSAMPTGRSSMGTTCSAEEQGCQDATNPRYTQARQDSAAVQLISCTNSDRADRALDEMVSGKRRAWPRCKNAT